MPKPVLIAACAAAALSLGACNYNKEYNNEQAYNAAGTDYNEGTSYGGNAAGYDNGTEYNAANAANTADNYANTAGNAANTAENATTNSY
jgi:hypothetical protein